MQITRITSNKQYTNVPGPNDDRDDMPLPWPLVQSIGFGLQPLYLQVCCFNLLILRCGRYRKFH